MIKLNAGFSRKVGEANFGSRGASVNLELELDSGAIQDPDKMHARIRSLFGLARKAVDEELNNGGSKEQTPADVRKPPAKPAQQKPGEPVCAECGGTGLSEKVVKFSTEQYGRPVCYRCQKNLKCSKGAERR